MVKAKDKDEDIDDTEDADEETDSDEESEDSDDEKSAKTSVSIEHAGGTREFTKELHGKDFEKKAKMFADKHKGKIL